LADKLYRAEIDVIVNEDLAESRISKFQKNFERRVAAMNRIKISPAATIQDRVTSSAKKIEASLNRMNRIKVNPTVSIQDRISSSLQRVESNINRLTRSSHKIVLEGVDRVTNVAKRIISTVTSPLALIGGGAGVAAAIGFPLKLAGEMDRARRSIEFYSDSVEEGRENFERFVNLAVKSPVYEVPFVVQTAGQLLASGQTADFAERALQAFGNAAMYTGASLSQLQLAFYGFKQIAAVGTLQMEELKQVTENLNVNMSWVAEELGLTGDKFRELGKAGIPAEKAMEAIVRTFEKRFPMKDFSGDLLALIANLRETARLVVWDFGEGMAKPVTRILQDLTGIMEPTSKKFTDFREQVKSAGEQVGESMERVYTRIKELFSEERFQGMSFGDKIIFLIDRGLDEVNNYLDGPGGEKVESIFTKLGSIAGRAWIASLKGTFTIAAKETGQGNIFGALAFGGLFSLLGGGLILRGLYGAGRKAFSASRWIGRNIIKPSAVPPIVSPGVTATAAGTAPILSSGGRISNIPIGAVAEEAGLAGAASRAAGYGSEALAAAGGLVSRVGRFVGRVAWPLAIGTGVLEVVSEKTTAGKVAKAAEVGTGLAGGWGGAKLGAAIGTAILPGIGSALGAALGGIGGYFGGREFGKRLVTVKPAEAGELTTPPPATGMADFRQFEAVQPEEAAQLQALLVPASQVTAQYTAILASFNVNLQNQATEIIARMGAWSEQAWTITGIATAFSANLQNMANEVISRGLSFAGALSDAANRAGSFVMPSFGASGATPVEPHAAGGIFSSPHLGVVAEAGPEAIIPLSERMRSRSLELWQRVGQYFGIDMPAQVVPHSDGGIFGSLRPGPTIDPEAVTPISERMRKRGIELLQQVGGYLGGYSMAPAFAGGYQTLGQQLSMSPEYSPMDLNQPVTATSGGINVSVSGVSVAVNMPKTEIDEDELAWAIGRRIVKDIVNNLENRI
jgi:tape measure domain-containing protein